MDVGGTFCVAAAFNFPSPLVVNKQNLKSYGVHSNTYRVFSTAIYMTYVAFSYVA